MQGQIIAAAIAAQATVETDAITIDPDKLLELQAGQSGSPYRSGEGATDFPINPERVAPLLRRLISPTRTRARIYDTDGALILDSRGLYMRGLIQSFDLPPLGQEKSLPERWWDAVKLWYRSGELPVYEEIGSANGREYAEVASALNGQSASVVRVGEDGGLIVSVAVPVQRYRAILGSLLLSTESGDIDAIVQAERMAILRVFLVAAADDGAPLRSCSPAPSPARCGGSPPPPSGSAAGSSTGARRSPISATARTRSAISRACSPT